MSKHHQSSRRKSYGRRQHEVRERHDRHHQPEGFEVEYGEPSNARPQRPVRVPRSARAAPPLHVGRLTVAVYEGARPRTITLGGRPRIAEGPTLGRRRMRTAVRAGRRPGHWSLVLGAIVIAFLLAFFWLAQVVRESATGYDIGRLQVTRDRLDSRPRTSTPT